MNSQETEICYAPLTQGEVVATLYNADSKVPLLVEHAETRVREKLGTAIGIDGGRVANYEGLIDAVEIFIILDSFETVIFLSSVIRYSIFF